MQGLFEAYNSNLIYEMALSAGELVVRVVPMLIVAVFLAESARIWLGEERLRRLLVGRHSWTGRLRALALAAVLPFCECGAFPVMMGLIRAGVPAGAVLTFFLVSPVVSMPAFMILMGVFGFPLSMLYLLLTSAAAVGGTFLLEPAGKRWGMFKTGVVIAGEHTYSESLEMACNSSCEETGAGESCCSEAAGSKTGEHKNNPKAVAGPAWNHTLNLLKRVFPYIAVIILVSALLRSLIPENLIQQALAARAPFDVLVAALVGIPVYSGDCAMIALVAPLIGVTGAVGAGIAFIISGSGTSINGIIFMSSVFKRQFLVLYVFTVICIALIVGYLISALLAFRVF